MDPSSAVLPAARVDGTTVHFAYYLPGCIDSAVVAFCGVSAWSYGPPNDEGLGSHPLWGHGLSFYNFHRVEPVLGSGDRRWLATFHDGTLEVVAGEREVAAARVPASSPSAALDSVLGPGVNRMLDE